MLAVWFAASVAVVFPVFASDNLPLTLDGAIALAIRKRTDIQIGAARIDALEARIGETESGFLPSLNFTSELQRINNYDTYTGISAAANIGGQVVNVDVIRQVQKYQTSAGVSLNYDLYTGGRTTALYREASANLDAGIAKQEEKMRSVALEVAIAYWELRKAQVAYIGMLRAAEFAQKLAELALVRLKEGKVAEIDALTEVANAEENNLTAATTKQSMRDRLVEYQTALGVPVEPDMEPLESLQLSTNPTTASTVVGDDQLPVEARLRGAEADVRSARMRVRASEANNYPSVTLEARFVTIGRSNTDFEGASSNSHRDSAFIGLRLQYNLFDGFMTKYRQERAIAEENQARLAVEQIMASAERSRKLAESSAKRAMNNVAIEEKRLELAKMHHAIAIAKFKAGREKEIEVSRASLEVQNVRDQLLSSQIGVALAKLRAQLGNPI